ncbi:3-keto-5-aminohexanoate cleavage protein [Glycomyces buryatensis]|uniref:3-keto-5-aminohexanoate cleavage protein n=1 Tax=Glycomyces buryatensis TaxID=2570927 RepID=A0A4S8Q8F4_9ACTN|nr:3-keto-5-aminohexanoate cleavage protein [Glycomyces buryatensis]THV37159.1 3-keto-5-aminohexanoate cleavage protein [Glycomyces buryatensis]
MGGTLITVAPTGAEADKAKVPELPVTLDELVETAVACERAGAAVIHVHIRGDDAKPTLDQGRLRDTVATLREATGLVVQLSSGGAVTDPESDRLAVLDAEPDMASCTMGTVNFGDDVFMNRWGFIVELHRRMQDRAVVPEYELFDLGHLPSLARLLDEHGLPFGGHVHVDFVLGVPGGAAGDAATVTAFAEGVRRYLPEGTTFSATGIGRTTLPVMFASLASGGHLRVGMEDTVQFARRTPVKDNAQLVKRAAEAAKLAQRPPMSTAEARKLLGIRDTGVA